MKSKAIDPILPNDIAALRFACRCFDIRVKSRQTVSPMKVSRAARGKGASPAVEESVRRELRERLAERFRRHKIAPVGVTNSFTDELVSSLLNLYERLHVKLDASRISQARAMPVLIEHVFVPTAFLAMHKFHAYGLGSEFAGAQSWYLPTKTMTPVQRVLDCWLRVAGFRTAYGVSRSLTKQGDSQSRQWDTEKTEKKKAATRKQLDNWLKGKSVPAVEDLEKLVQQYPDEVKWLDDPIAWKARFQLALAMHHAVEELETMLTQCGKFTKLCIADSFERMNKEGVICDTKKTLAAPGTFFAVRLLQLRLQKEGKFEAIIAPSRQQRNAVFGPEATDDEIDNWRKSVEWEMNPGNWFLAFIRKRGEKAGRIKAGDYSAEAYFALDEYIFDIGVEELTLLMKEGRRA